LIEKIDHLWIFIVDMENSVDFYSRLLIECQTGWCYGGTLI